MPVVVAVMPIGPNCRPEFVADTLASIRAYTPDGTRVVLVDDSGRGTAEQVADAGCVVVPAVAHGSFGQLYENLCAGFRAALEEPFDVLLRIDTDALVAAPFLDVVHDYFTDHPEVGSLGSFHYGYQEVRRSFSWSARRLVRSMTLFAPRYPRTAATAARLTLRARRHSYELGEGIMGGVVVYSRRAVEALAQHDLLPAKHLADTGLQEDQLFALTLRSAGFELADFGTQSDDLPFATKHVGMPAHPTELLAKGKSLIHSTRSYEDMDEAEVRAVFAEARDQENRRLPNVVT